MKLFISWSRKSRLRTGVMEFLMKMILGVLFFFCFSDCVFRYQSVSREWEKKLWLLRNNKNNFSWMLEQLSLFGIAFEAIFKPSALSNDSMSDISRTFLFEECSRNRNNLRVEYVLQVHENHEYFGFCHSLLRPTF